LSGSGYPNRPGYATAVKSFAPVLLALGLVAVVLAGAPGSAEAKTACGSFKEKHLKVSVYRIRGSVSCARARGLSRHVIGSACQGQVLVAGYRCYPGAPALHEPAASGFTLRKGRTVIEGRVRQV
jgi:hypothetical protein